MQPSDKFQIPSTKIQINTFEEEYKQQLQSHIQHLNISGNSYSLEFCEEFGKRLLELNTVQTLNMNDVFVSRKKEEIPQSISFIFSPLFLTKNLQKLDLSNNAISINGAIALKPYLSQANSLQIFLINNCGLGITGATHISEALKIGTPNLLVWAMSRNRIEDEGAVRVSEAISKMQNLKELYIYQNFIRNQGMLQVFKELKNCKEIEIIDVQDNYIKGETAQHLSELILTSQKIRVLNLSDCNISQEENTIILEAMKQSELKIEKLGYNYNELDSDQAKSLLDILLKEKGTLKRLDIKGNEFEKSTKKYYKENLLKAEVDQKVLSKYESDSEEENELVDMFSNLNI